MALHHDLGPFIRVWGIPLDRLPGNDSRELAPFTQAVLTEAIALLDGVAPKIPSADDGTRVTTKPWDHDHQIKKFPDSAASVHLNSRRIPADLLRGVARANPGSHAPPADRIRAETWVARVSVHEDAAQRGTASWGEFYDAVKVRHAESERDFTPSIMGMRTAREWDCGGLELKGGKHSWGEVTCRIVESKHLMPVGMSRRIFAVVQMTAAVKDTDEKEFVVVSIPVRDFEHAPETQFFRESGGVVGCYAAVERVRRLPGGPTEWVMATASEARGYLPSWLQARAVPGQIAKDVPLFLAWADRQRHKWGRRGPHEDEDPFADGAHPGNHARNG
ncbi:hypothetical protein VUR80DRAFT_5023 [Thermomyces stellatus]